MVEGLVGERLECEGTLSVDVAFSEEDDASDVVDVTQILVGSVFVSGYSEGKNGGVCSFQHGDVGGEVMFDEVVVNGCSMEKTDPLSFASCD